MNYAEFAGTIRKKYPGSYDSVDDKVLAQKIVEKYPAYADKVSFDEEAKSYGVKDYVGDIARPILIGGGAIGGGIAGAALGGPVGAAGGGAIGFGTGKAAANLLDRKLGRLAPIESLPQAAGEIGTGLYEGAQAEATGLGAGFAVPRILKAAGSTGAQLGEWATGIPKRDFETVAKNPTSMFPGVMGKAKKLFGKAAAEAGVSDEITPELLQRIKPSSSGASNYAFDAYEKILSGEQLAPKDALAARQALDAVYPLPNAKNASYIRILDKMRSTFQDVIASASPELQKASKEYAIAKGAQKFKHVLPQTTTGKPSYFRSAAVLGGLAAGKPWAAFGSPVVAGATTAGAGAVGKATNAIIQNPSALRGAVAPLFGAQPVPEPGLVNPTEYVPAGNQEANKQQEQAKAANGKGNKVVKHPSSVLKKRILDEKTALEYLDRANNDIQLARQMAEEDGWTIP